MLVHSGYRVMKRPTESICSFCRAPNLHIDNEVPRLNKKELGNAAVLIGVTFSTFYFPISEAIKLSWRRKDAPSY